MIYDLVGQQQRSWGRDLGNVSHTRSLSLILYYHLWLSLNAFFLSSYPFVYDLGSWFNLSIRQKRQLTIRYSSPFDCTIYYSASVLKLCLFRAFAIFCPSVELFSPSSFFSLFLSIFLTLCLYLFRLSLYLFVFHRYIYTAKINQPLASQGDDYKDDHHNDDGDQ